MASLAMDLLALALAAAVGAVVAWMTARRRSGQQIASAVAPHLLPDPALEWLRRAHQALGVWITELDASEEGPRAERILEPERLSVAQIVAVDRRLERARDQEQSGVERMEGGMLVFRGQGGAAVGLLLPEQFEATRLDGVEDDLRRLLDGVRRRPHIVALTQAQAQEASLESVGSVGLRLAYQLERTLDAQVVVAAVENGRARVIGVSGRGDRRLLDSVLPAESALARVADGTLEPHVSTTDPVGGVVADRRSRAGSVLLVPLKKDLKCVGAVAIWLGAGREPTGAVRAEMMEALHNAAPRIDRALEADRHKRAATVDPLTGLHNRRGFDEAFTLITAKTGTLVYADLDRFKNLNDTLGHPAGDAALVHFARIIREQIRSGDVAGRIGGEEFAVWLPETSLDLGVRIAERIRAKLGNTAWDWRGRTWPLSASFGVAACPETSRSLDNLPAQADSALYAAKRGGRNRVEQAAR
ncbi:MAG TPA: GGDEF domain-containing protein [Gemmatimonadales bacterium]|nr:GGDEF domain-containing protein [Gemmatimonadales bacterium]